MYRDAQYEGV